MFAQPSLAQMVNFNETWIPWINHTSMLISQPLRIPWIVFYFHIIRYLELPSGYDSHSHGKSPSWTSISMGHLSHGYVKITRRYHLLDSIIQEHTDDAFEAATKRLLQAASQRPRVALMLATHNRASLWKLVCYLSQQKPWPFSGEDSWIPGSFRKGW